MLLLLWLLLLLRLLLVLWRLHVRRRHLPRSFPMHQLEMGLATPSSTHWQSCRPLILAVVVVQGRRSPLVDHERLSLPHLQPPYCLSRQFFMAESG